MDTIAQSPEHKDTIARETACVGHLTASASHELQNALAVIRESAGLMEDILLYADEDEPEIPYKGKILELLKSIQEQVVRGGNIAGGLNGLGHAWQEDGGDLNRVLEEFAILAGRLGRMRNVTVGLKYGDSKVRAQRAGLMLRVALFDVLQACLNYAHGTSLTLSPVLHNGISGVLIHMEPSINEQDTMDEKALLSAIHRAGANPLNCESTPELPLTVAGYTFFMPCED